MEWIQKAWGASMPILETSELAVYFAEAKPGGYCSIHLHKYKLNRFYVRQGAILVFMCTRDRWQAELLNRGDVLEVPAGVRHVFFSKSGCRFWECYWPVEPKATVDPSDIVRFSGGGRLSGCEDFRGLILDSYHLRRLQPAAADSGTTTVQA